jgi:hypothetical protein
MATPGRPTPPYEMPSGFGPPTGFTLPGGPKLPGASGEVRTGRETVLALAATALCLPVGIAALVFVLRASLLGRRGQTDDARRALRWARRTARAGLAVGVVGWVVVTLVLWRR